MSRNEQHPQHGGIGYIQIPSTDVEASCAFYRADFGWDTDPQWSGFTAPGFIGQFVTDRRSTRTDGPLLWLAARDMDAALGAVTANGGTVVKTPEPDQGARLLAEIDDPSGNRVGVFSRLATGA